MIIKSTTIRFVMAMFAIALCTVRNGIAADDKATPGLPHAVKFELGRTQFAPGDSITVQKVRGTSESIKVGETYCVEGTYTLNSCDEANLCFFATTVGESGPTPIDARQQVRVKKGSGSFRLTKIMNEDGYLHLSFYPVPSGSDLGGIYFGQGDRIYGKSPMKSTSPHSTTSLTGPNRALLEYLGNPVPPPANLDPKYTKEGLTQAVELAAKNAGITVEKISIDDSEFPFLVGVIYPENEFPKLAAQFRKLEGYQFSGGIDGPTCAVINLVPYRAFPTGAHHRFGLREQVFHDRIMGR